jgi:hypothetical protein
MNPNPFAAFGGDDVKNGTLFVLRKKRTIFGIA